MPANAFSDGNLLKALLFDFKHTFQRKNIFECITSSQPRVRGRNRSAKCIKSDTNLIIIKSDKGGRIFRMNKQVYLNKVSTPISEPLYIEVEKNSSNPHLSVVQMAISKSVILNNCSKNSV